MTHLEAPKPFLAERYDLPGGVSLGLMTPEEAETAGTICAGIEPWASYPFPADLLVAFFAKTEAAAPRFTLRSGGQFAGALALRLNWMRGPYVHMLMIAPAFQGRGLGTAVLQWVEQQARLGGERNMWILVTSTNTAARKLYERFGFSFTAELDGLVTDAKSEILLRRRLP